MSLRHPFAGTFERVDYQADGVTKAILNLLPWLATQLLREAVSDPGHPWCDAGQRLYRHRILSGRVPACREFSAAAHREFSRAVFRCDHPDAPGSRGA